MNPMNSGVKSRDNRGYVETRTSEALDQVLASDEHKQRVAQIRQGQEALKDGLPWICPHYTHFRGNHRSQQDIVAESFTFMTCVDIDDPEQVEQAISRAWRLELDPDSDWEGQVLLIDYSARKKAHIFIRIPVGKTIKEAQQLFCEELGVDFDEKCITPERMVYMTGDEVYRSPHWLEPLNQEEVDERREAYLLRGLDVDGRKAVPSPSQGGQTSSSEVDEALVLTPETAKVWPDKYHGFTFKAIIAKYWELHNDGHEPTEGDRDTLTYQLACDLRHICGRRFEWLDQVIPCYDGFTLKEKQAKIRSALQSPFESFPQRLKDTLRALRLDRKKAVNNAGQQSAEGHPGGGVEPPPMPRRLPELIKLLVSQTPDVYRPAVAHAVFPALAAHLWRTRFRYINNVQHEATLMNILMAGTGTGKDCISEPINRIMSDIRQRDHENMQREKEWKNIVNQRGDNKDKPLRPEGLIIQEIDADVTNAAFVERMAEAEEHFLYVKMNELDQMDALKGNGKAGQQFQIMCLAFDPSNTYGQTRVGTKSVTERVRVRFNWNASTTIAKGQRYFSRVLTDGPISRINFCTIPEREIGADIPVYGTYDAEFDEQLRPYIERLVAARGEVECPKASRLAKRMKEECAEFARLSQSRVYENLSFRALIIAWLKACVLYVAHGCKWDKSIEDFARWSLHYDLWCKMQFFGEAIAKANSDNCDSFHRGPRNLLELLPDEFNLDDAVSIRRRQGMDAEGTQGMIRMWMHRKYILQITDNSFQKLKYKNGKTRQQ